MTIAHQFVCVALVVCASCSPRNEGVPAKFDCIANLKQLDGAKGVWQIENHKATNDTPSMQDLVGSGQFLREAPRCRSDGIYTLVRVDEKPRCSIEGHEL